MAVQSQSVRRNGALAQADAEGRHEARFAGVVTYILAASVLGVLGQIMLKAGLASLGVLSLEPVALPATLLSVALNPLIVLGLAVTVSGTFFWLILLSRVDLSYAYPFASLNYVLVLAASWLVLGERMSAVRLVGVAAICLGVCLVMRTPVRSGAAESATPPTSVDGR